MHSVNMNITKLLRKSLYVLVLCLIGSCLNSENTTTEEPDVPTDPVLACPIDIPCSKLGGDCIDCKFTNSCVYGQELEVQCEAKQGLSCSGERVFTRKMVCQYCYQTSEWEQECTKSTECHVVSAPPERYQANCTVKPEILCLGRRRFYKRLPCNWTSGYRWSSALALSIALGGFGVDRFYLGLWREGIGKLFSFGGLGVWTLVDVILVATGYVSPADGSLYIF